MAGPDTFGYNDFEIFKVGCMNKVYTKNLEYFLALKEILKIIPTLSQSYSDNVDFCRPLSFGLTRGYQY